MEPRTFNQWWAAVQSLALDTELKYLLSSDPEAHRKSYVAGETPEDELQSLIDDDNHPI